MFSFSSDADLARFEPGVFGDWYLSSQVLCSGSSGIVSGTQFLATGADFEAANVQAGGVIWLQSADGLIEGVYEIVDVVDADQLILSVLRVDEQQAAIPVGLASNVTWRILTYGVQGYEVLWELSQRLGVSPGCPEAAYDVADIVNAQTLRQVSAFGVLSMIFTAMDKGAEDQAILAEKKEYYQLRYEEALKRLNVKIDTDGDGDADKGLQPGMIRLVRK